MTAAVYDNCNTCWNSCAANPGDECRPLRTLSTDTNGVGFPSHTSIENIDIVATGREVDTGVKTQSDVVVARRIITKRILTGGRVIAAGCVAVEATLTIGSIVVSGSAIAECINPGGRVVEASCVAQKRALTAGCVAVASCVAAKRLVPSGGIVKTSRVILESSSTCGSIVATGHLNIRIAPIASEPIAVLLLPVVLKKSALKPVAVL